jgi:hypothetical protein
MDGARQTTAKAKRGTATKTRLGSNPLAWYRARERLGQIARLSPGWNGGRGAVPDEHTVNFAAKELAGLENAALLRRRSIRRRMEPSMPSGT